MATVTASTVSFNNGYQVFPSFIDKNLTTSPTPFLMPPTFSVPQGQNVAVGSSIVVSISNLLPGTATPPPYTNNDFQFSVMNGAVQIIIVGTGNVWCADSTARTALMGNFTDLLQNLETTYELAGQLVPGATYIIGQALADTIPAPLMETLFYRYSLSTGFAPQVNKAYPARAFVDVRPGMRLRVENSSSEYVSPGSPLNGYVGNGRCEYLVGATATGGAARVVTFDAFLGTVKAPAVNGGTTTPAATSGGLLDLQAAGSGRTYMRLFYPSSVNAPGLPGSLSNTGNPALVGAQTLSMMNQATQNYPTWNQTPPSGTSPNNCIIFLGRAAVVPEIQVFVTIRNMTSAMWVPVGTTLSNIAQRFTALTPTNGWAVLPVQIQRLNSLFPGTPVGVDTRNNQPTTGAVPANMFDVPLIAGDLLTFSF